MAKRAEINNHLQCFIHHLHIFLRIFTIFLAFFYIVKVEVVVVCMDISKVQSKALGQPNIFKSIVANF